MKKDIKTRKAKIVELKAADIKAVVGGVAVIARRIPVRGGVAVKK